MLSSVQDERELNANDSAVGNDCRFLVSHMEAYFSLGLLLTASEEDAESCFVLALEKSSKASGSRFPRAQELAHKSMKRAVVDSAIQICDPVFGRVRDESELDIAGEKSASSRSPWVACILQLETFERFVFVLSVLESYSDKECANLLHCQLEDIAKSRVQAFYSLSAAWRNWFSYDA
jgi:hypothetical protein